MAAVPPIPPHLTTVTPRLVVSDGAAAIDFYVSAFGAEPVGERHTMPDGALIHAELRIGSAIVMLTQDTADASPARAPDGDRPVNVILATYWEDVDGAWERALAAGAEVIYPLADQFYGERAGRLRDPYGHQWMLSRVTEVLSADEIARRGAALS
ncbi:MAG: VOC family protein [Solirubrobacteraceae bacterium]